MAKKKSKQATKPESRTFVRITEAGILGANDKARVAITFNGRSIAPTDHPMQFFLEQLFGAVENFIGWSSVEAAQKDFDAAIECLKEWKDSVDSVS